VWNESADGSLWAVLEGHTGAVRGVACLVTQVVVVVMIMVVVMAIIRMMMMMIIRT